MEDDDSDNVLLAVASAVQAAVEGECDGLAVTNGQALSIAKHIVDTVTPPNLRPSPQYVAKMVRNILANEYGLTKARVRDMLMESVQREAVKLIAQENVVRRLLEDSVKNTIFGSQHSAEQFIRTALHQAARERINEVVAAARIEFPKKG